jgi:hypothetical protein
MSLNPLYIVPLNLEEVFVNHGDGTLLANGTIEFYKDDDRLVSKSVYELTGAPPNYTYAALPNPLNLSSVGTPVDNSGNPVSIYYYPYDVNGDIELYYIVVRDSSGTIQFTRQAWPNTTSSSSPTPSEVNPNITNELSNPQFVDINFSLTNPFTISFSGSSTTTVAIAPRWNLVIGHSGTGTVAVQRNAVVGTSAYPYNPPYTLTVTPGLNVTSLTLVQRLNNNPDVFAPAPAGTNGWLSASVLLAPSSGVTIQYQPNGQSAQTILTATNSTGSYQQFDQTVQLTAANNTNDGDSGYVDIIVGLSIAGATTLSNIQILGLDADATTVNYDQNTANRQKDQLFNYYNPLLQYKPIESYLVGWDFPLNPAQPLGPTVAASSAGANTSAYKWDQTIVFQSANSGPAISRSSTGNGALRVTATNSTQFALVQYLPQAVARRMLQENLSANVAAITAKVGGLTGVISIWYTTDGSLPSTGSNNSLILTLDANGKPATFNGNWTEVTRNGLGDAKFNVTNANGLLFNDYSFSGWSLNGAAAVNTATFVAVVVGFASLTAAGTIDIGSISVVPGSIATRPAPQTPSEVISDCCYYYQKSFEQATVPANNVGLNTGEYRWPALITGTAANGEQATSIPFGYGMISVPTVTLYNPALAGTAGQGYNVLRSENLTNTLVNVISAKSMQISANGSASTSQSDALAVHWSADSRLGL